jgi:hypothetical protein
MRGPPHSRRPEASGQLRQRLSRGPLTRRSHPITAATGLKARATARHPACAAPATCHCPRCPPIEIEHIRHFDRPGVEPHAARRSTPTTMPPDLARRPRNSQSGDWFHDSRTGKRTAPLATRRTRKPIQVPAVSTIAFASPRVMEVDHSGTEAAASELFVRRCQRRLIAAAFSRVPRSAHG